MCKLKIIIIQYLKEQEMLSGLAFKFLLEKNKDYISMQCPLDFYDVHSKNEFIEVLESIVNNEKYKNTPVLLHLESHGGELGIGPWAENALKSEFFFSYISKLEKLSGGKLTLLLGTCMGANSVNNHDNTGLSNILYSRNILLSGQAFGSFRRFYERFLKDLNFEESINYMHNDFPVSIDALGIQYGNSENAPNKNENQSPSLL